MTRNFRSKLKLEISWGKIAEISEFQKIMRSKKCLQNSGARRTRVFHHHGSDTPTYPNAISLHTDQFYVLFCTRLYNGILIRKVDSCSSTVFIFGQDSRKTVHDGREVFFILLLSSLSLYQKNMSAVSGEQRDSTSYKQAKKGSKLFDIALRFFHTYQNDFTPFWEHSRGAICGKTGKT